MSFEWDPEKDKINQMKHGVSFEQAQTIWDQTHLEVVELARAFDGEIRNATIGWVGNEIYLAIWTQRSDRIRLISVRRARKHEKEIFLKKLQDQRSNG